MILSAIVLTTAIILTSLLWAQWQQWQEKRRRRQGAYSLAINKGHTAVAGCLGVFGYLGLLFVTLWLTFDIVEEATAPKWLNWVVVIGLLVSFFAFVGWAIGVGKSFASERLILDQQGIRLSRWGKMKANIRWREPWQLEQFVDVRGKRDVQFHEWVIDYALLLRLSQKREQLLLRFETEGERVGGLLRYEGDAEGYQVDEMAAWLETEIIRCAKKWREPDGEISDEKAAPEQFTTLPPDPQLMKALNFSKQDLALNRKGICQAKQITHIRRDSWMTLVTYIVMLLIFGGLAIATILRIVRGNLSETDGPALVVFLLVSGFCTVMAMAAYAGLQIEFEAVRVQGKITLQHYQQSGEYWLRVKETAVPVSKQVYNLLDDQNYYNLYFASQNIGEADKILISAEKLVG